MSERGDNGTVRLILANAIALDAVTPNDAKDTAKHDANGRSHQNATEVSEPHAKRSADDGQAKRPQSAAYVVESERDSRSETREDYRAVNRATRVHSASPFEWSNK
jgi:hypothetical protein